MRLSIKVKPSSGSERVIQLDNGSLEVWVTAAPTDGKANRAVIKAVAKHLGVPQSLISISRGGKGRNKVLEVL